MTYTAEQQLQSHLSQMLISNIMYSGATILKPGQLYGHTNHLSQLFPEQDKYNDWRTSAQAYDHDCFLPVVKMEIDLSYEHSCCGFLLA